MKNKLLSIVGPTASGKSALALFICSKINSIIISADSMQIYKGMDIGTAKPTHCERILCKHEMIDIAEINQPFSVAEYKSMAEDIIKNAHNNHILPILAGGTGLYINAVTREMDFAQVPPSPDMRRELYNVLNMPGGKDILHQKLNELDPNAAQAIHKNNVKRVVRAIEIITSTGMPMPQRQMHRQRGDKYDTLILGIKVSREKLINNINIRVDKMIKDGLIEETRSLLENGAQPESQAMQAIGYAETVQYIRNQISFDEMAELIKVHTRQYAKRQMTWFNKDPRIVWIDTDKLCGMNDVSENALQIIKHWMEK